MATQIKICGITTPQALQACAQNAVRYAGFVFVPNSPRFLEPEVAAQFCRALPTGLRGVALFVDPDDAALAATVQRLPMDYIQLHGQETPQRVAHIKAITGLKIIKAIGVADQSDLNQVTQWQGLVDMVLLDAKPPNANAPAGGNGHAFDWSILNGFNPPLPWMLSGGLTNHNVVDALNRLRPHGVDTSSGVEESRGVKSIAKIQDFSQAVRAADANRSAQQESKWGVKL